MSENIELRQLTEAIGAQTAALMSLVKDKEQGSGLHTKVPAQFQTATRLHGLGGRAKRCGAIGEFPTPGHSSQVPGTRLGVPSLLPPRSGRGAGQPIGRAEAEGGQATWSFA